MSTEPNGEGLDGLRAAGSQRDGVSGQQEVCPSRPRCQELHVSSSARREEGGKQSCDLWKQILVSRQAG